MSILMMGLFVCLLFLTILTSIVYYTFRLGISPLPTYPRTKKALFSLLPSHVPGDIYELGSGWGTLAFPLAKKYPRNRIIAYELSWVPYLFSSLRQKITRQQNLTIYRKDFFKEDLSRASLVVVYLYPAAMLKLSQKLPLSTPVISNTFFLPGRTPTQTLQIHDLFNTIIFLYVGK